MILSSDPLFRVMYQAPHGRLFHASETFGYSYTPSTVMACVLMGRRLVLESRGSSVLALVPCLRDGLHLAVYFNCLLLLLALLVLLGSPCGQGTPTAFAHVVRRR